MKNIALCAASDAHNGNIQCVQLADGRTIAIYVVNGLAYATDDHCTHGDSSLSQEGSLNGHIIECGLHNGTFDIRTGEALDLPCTKALRTYPVEIRDGKVYLSDSAPAAE